MCGWTNRRRGKLICSMLSAEDVLALQELVREAVPVADHVGGRYAIHLVRQTRLGAGGYPQVHQAIYVSWGAGPRASQTLVLAGKGAGKLLQGRYFCEHR